MKKAVAIGELLIDFVPQQKGCALDEVQQFERVAGGAPANVATAVARLGGEAKMISQVGEDAFGTHILKVLRAANVDISSVFRTNRANTALAFVSLDAAGNREFSFYRNPSADLFLDEKQITPEMFESCAVLHFCSVDLVDYPVRGAHRRAIELAKQAGAFISFDPNVRLPLWSSPADCQAAIRQFLPCADLVKLSDDEIEFVTGCADERAAAEKLFALGVRMVVVTRGANGSAAYTPSCATAFPQTSLPRFPSRRSQNICAFPHAAPPSPFSTGALSCRRRQTSARPVPAERRIPFCIFAERDVILYIFAFFLYFFARIGYTV